jgi:tubulin beta
MRNWHSACKSEVLRCRLCLYCGDNDAQLGRIDVFYDKVPRGKYVPRALLFDLEPGVIGALRASQLFELIRPGNLVNQNADADSS